MKSLREIMQSNKRFAVLGGRTLAENAAHWAEQRAKVAEACGAPHQVLEDPCDLPLHLSRCGVPSRLAAVVVAGPRPTSVVRAVKDWIEGDASFLVLHGESGGGKSLAASTVFLAARETIRWNGGEQTKWSSYDCGFLGATELARQSYFDDEGRQLVHHLKRVQLLVLDDLGAELVTAPFLSTLEDVLDARFSDRRKRTVLTTNVSLQRASRETKSDFETRYGARIARRIRESSQIVHCDGSLGAANGNTEAA